MKFQEAARYMNAVLLCALIIVGVVGNCLSVLTWSRGRHRRTSTAFLLTALAVSNIVVLLLPALEYWGQETWGKETSYYRLRNLNLPVCKLFAFASYFGPTTTSWILVLVTFERVVSMWFPFRVRYMCTRFKVGIAVTALLVICAALYIPILLETELSHAHYLVSSTEFNNTTSELQGYDVISSNSTHTVIGKLRCDISETGDFYRLYLIPWRWLDMCAVFIVPFIFIVIGNILIIWKLLKRRTLGLLSKEGKAVTCRTRVANAFTVRAIALSITFCLFTSPATIYAVIMQYILYDVRATNALVIAFIHILFYANSSVNFFLYCAIGSGFKQDLRTVLRNMCRKRKVSILQQSTSKYVCDGHRAKHNHISHAGNTCV